MDTAHSNIDHVIQASEWIRVAPRFMAPWIGSFFSSSKKSQKSWFDALERTIEQRLEYCGGLVDGHKPKDHPNDAIQWIIETAPKDDPWDAARIAREIMALWFGAIHGVSMTVTWALFDLCLHPEYVEPLRDELRGPAYDKFVETADGLPLLDSFIKESARFNPLDCSKFLGLRIEHHLKADNSEVTSRRVALEPFTYSDGTHVRKGDWTCMPLRSMLRDKKLFPNPDSFNGFRFVDGSVQPEGPSKATDVTYKWSMWGNKRLACPARFHAVLMVKLILAHILTNYDSELAYPDAPRATNWRTYLSPREDTEIILKPLSTVAI
ncbi:MAG: hypothetical protein Q9198_000331 [Flavoplaca austrocitrina]